MELSAILDLTAESADLGLGVTLGEMNSNTGLGLATATITIQNWEQNHRLEPAVKLLLTYGEAMDISGTFMTLSQSISPSLPICRRLVSVIRLLYHLWKSRTKSALIVARLGAASAAPSSLLLEFLFLSTASSAGRICITISHTNQTMTTTMMTPMTRIPAALIPTLIPILTTLATTLPIAQMTTPCTLKTPMTSSMAPVTMHCLQNLITPSMKHLTAPIPPA